MPNTNATKIALGEALKKLMQTKRLEKITISDLTTDCGVSRMAFYYHFKDIYDLVEWVCMEDGKRALADKNADDTWQEGISRIFEAVLENKEFITNVCRSIGRERVERYLYRFTYDIVRDVVEEKCRNAGLSEKQKDSITDFYKYGFVGTVLNWIDHGMKENYSEIVENMSVMLYENIDHSVNNFKKAAEHKEP